MGNSKKISILIADDHAITRDGIKTLLELYDDFDLIGEAKNGKEAIDLCLRSYPDVVLMDLEMPVLSGVEAIIKIKKSRPDTKIIALSSFADKKLVKDAIKAGATSYIIKNISRLDLTASMILFTPLRLKVMVAESPKTRASQFSRVSTIPSTGIFAPR